MVELTAEQLANRALDLDLLSQRQLASIWDELGSHNVAVADFQRVVLGHGLLTNYQLDRLARNERGGFFYGKYKVLYLVGTGSFARVYRVANTNNGEVFALKVLRKRFSENPLQTEQFLREGRMGAKLRHPNIVPIFEVHSEKRMHYLVMEFVEGQNLRDFVKVRRKLSLEDAVKLTTDVTAGLAYAAERGITHRDLKLSNVLVSSSGRAQLVDFGLAAATQSDEMDESTNPRTIDYAGLEKATAAEKDDYRSDIFFNGCMFYQMLSGVAPLIETRDRLQRMNTSRFNNIKPIKVVAPELPPRVAMIVKKAMELDPEKRYQSQTEMLADLKIVQLRLKEGRLDQEEDPETVANVTTTTQKSVMIVESNPEMQDVFRTRLKKEGFRVLVMRDPALALQRFEREPNVADCVVFSCLDLGSQAAQAFVRFGQLTSTKHLPAVLLLDTKQKAWAEQVETNEHRMILTMPIKMRELRSILEKVLA